MYRFQQFLILIAHLILLWWIIYVLQNSGQFTVEKTILHFLGLSAMGAGLIFGTAKWAKYHHKNNSDH
tara:strand:- start:50 stop:253 length:204 start_codon:yes stop_codon:yes gene_type:complete